jgi:DUF4097 and DUF4098 domain-containing protein YvlB
MKTTSVIFMVLFLAGTIALANDSVRTLELPKDGIDVIDIDCEAGFLKVYGIPNLDQIEVKAEIEVDFRDSEDRDDFIQRRVRLSLEKRGSRAVLISHIDNHSFFNRHALINLTVRIPQGMNLNVEDGSGEIEIRDVSGSVRIDDGSGDIDLANITGDVDVSDGSGGLIIKDINGNLEVDDGSGEIEINGVQGDLYVDDGSGSMRISKITGSVVVSDGSGSIDINGVDQDVTIRESGSGGLSVHDVKGKVSKRD